MYENIEELMLIHIRYNNEIKKKKVLAFYFTENYFDLHNDKFSYYILFL